MFDLVNKPKHCFCEKTNKKSQCSIEHARRKTHSLLTGLTSKFPVTHPSWKSYSISVAISLSFPLSMYPPPLKSYFLSPLSSNLQHFLPGPHSQLT